MQHNPRLDSLRALAAVAVLAFHSSVWCGWGWMGVPLFFVLSGYLITSILLESKQSALGLASFLKSFFLRRVLRLVPVYALFLAATLVWFLFSGQYQQLLADLPSLLTYTFNFELLRHPGLRVYGHLWTLSVEWQFYLFWPLLVWFCSERTIKRVLLGMICLMPLLRYVSVRWFVVHGDSFHDATDQTYLLTWSHVDSLAIGSLLAWRRTRELLGSRPVAIGAVAFFFSVGFFVTLLGRFDGYWGLRSEFAQTFGFPSGLEHYGAYVWGYSLIGFCFATVLAAVSGPTASAGIFEWGWLRYLGKVSYGFYLFHGPVVQIVRTRFARIPVGNLFQSTISSAMLSLRLALAFITSFGLTFLLAHISYQYWERAFMRKQNKPLHVRHSDA